MVDKKNEVDVNGKKLTFVLVVQAVGVIAGAVMYYNSVEEFEGRPLHPTHRTRYDPQPPTGFFDYIPWSYFKTKNGELLAPEQALSQHYRNLGECDCDEVCVADETPTFAHCVTNEGHECEPDPTIVKFSPTAR